jgi:hypothetical protein
MDGRTNRRGLGGDEEVVVVVVDEADEDDEEGLDLGRLAPDPGHDRGQRPPRRTPHAPPPRGARWWSIGGGEGDGELRQAPARVRGAGS